MGSFFVDNAPKPAAPTPPAGFDPNMGTAPRNDFNLGGFQQQGFDTGSYIPPGVLYGGGASDPRRGAVDPYASGAQTPMPDPRVTTQPQPYQQLPTGDGVTGAFGGGISRPPGGSLGQMGQNIGQQIMQGRPRGGGFWGNLGRAFGFGGGQSQGPIQQQMQQNGGFYAPPAISRPPDQQSQQPGQVGMHSPDGQHFQYVNQEHVPHYQSRGATIYNGSSYGGGNGQ